MRHISNSQLFQIYFKTSPILIGEVFFVLGLLIVLFNVSQTEGFYAIIFLAAGAYFVWKKINKMQSGHLVLKNGLEGTARVFEISETLMEHNDRTVMEYNFTYEVDGKEYTYAYQSAYHRHLKIGDKLKIYYLKESPWQCFIPELYNIKVL